MVENSFIASQVKDLSYIDTNYEINTVKITLEKSDIFIIGIYHPPNKNSQKFIESLDEILNKLKDKSIILSGDFNIDLLRIHSNNNANLLLNSLISYALYPTITRATRINKKQVKNSSLLDWTWTNLGNHKESHIILSDISDHFPTLSSFRTKTPLKRAEYIFIKYREIKNQECHKIFLTKLEKINYDFIHNQEYTLERKFEIFEQSFFLCFNEAFPIKTKRISVKRIFNPWLTPEIECEIKRKHSLHKLFLNGGIPIETYKNFQKYLSKLITKAKKEFCFNKLQELNGDVRKQWAFINKLTNRKSFCRITPTTISENDENFTEIPEIGGKFNEHFISVGPKIHASIPHVNKDPLDYLSNITVGSSFEFKSVNETDVLEIINSLHNKSCNIFSIPNIIYKLGSARIIYPLKCLINDSLSTAHFPSLYKSIKVIPLFKAGCRKSMNNYRPISLLMTTSKIIEKIVNKQILEYFNSNNLFSKYQFGFRNKHSTQDANNLLLENIYKHINSKSNVIILYIDLKKAYDTIDINLLLKKLKYYGLNSSSIKWFESYLTGRKQSVWISEYLSPPLTISVGIPQGSVLGPTLFNIFINDFEFCHNALSIQYADDTSLVIHDKNFKILEQSTNENLSSNALWLASNKLALNVQKTVYMMITNKKAPELNITINGTKIEKVKEFKSLGLIIDEKLTFMPHCNYVTKRLSTANYILYKNKNFLNFKSKMLIYNSLALPHLSYNNAIWGSAPECHLKKVQISQNKIIRNIIYDPTSSTTDKFHNLKVLNIHEIHEYQCILYMYKIRNNKCPESIAESIEINQFSHRYNTRNKFLKRPQYLLSMSQRAVSYKGPTFWNNLPTHLQDQSCSLTIFKKQLKTHILQRVSQIHC